MKKYTKEITALLTIVTAGIIGGSVYAADISETRTAGETVVNQAEETNKYDGNAPTAGIAMPDTEETEITPTMGAVMPVTEETEITPTMGVVMPVTEETEITPTMGVVMPVTSDDIQVSTVPVSQTPPVTSPSDNTHVRGRGDINGSSQTDLSDLIILSQYLLKDIKLDEQELIEADMTKDGTVDITDLPALKMKIMTPEGSDISNNDDSDKVDGPETDHSYATINLNHGPDKTEYKIGEPLDLSGTVISASGHSPQGPTWDIFSHNVTLDDTMVKVDASSFNNQVPGTYEIIISCKAAPVSTSFTVTVTE